MPSPVESDNPYAPPAAGSEELESMPGCWSVQGDYLVVRENAVLPAVDLDGRGAGGPVTPMVLRLPVPAGGKGIAVIFISAPVIIGCMYFLPAGGRHFGVLVAMVAGMVFVPLFQRGLKIRESPAFLWGQASVPALRARTQRARRRGYVALASTLFLLVFLGIAFVGRRQLAESLGSGSMEVFGWAVAVACLGLAGFLGVAVWSAIDTGWRCTKARDGWLWIKGIGPAALGELARRSGEPAPAPVRRKVFKFQPQRLTLTEPGALNGFRPMAWWRILGMMSRKPGMQEQLSYHWSEREWLEPGEGDLELMADWQRHSAGTPLAEWRMTHGERIGAPARCIRSEEIVFLSPDGRHAAMSMMTRMASGKGLLMERRETAFRSWTADGRIIATGNRPMSGPLPAEMNFEMRSGSPWELALRHLARVASEPLVAVDAAGLRAKEEEEMQRRQEVLEDAGIYGPVEEMEVPGDWD